MPRQRARSREESRTTVRVRRVRSARDARSLRPVFREYARAVGPHFRWGGFAEEVRSLPQTYLPPDGSLIVARVGSRIAGMVAVRRWSGTICEMKRLYVRPAFRGRGLGRRLVLSILAEARRLGYGRIRLDSLHTMKAAQAIYQQAGFKRIPPYLPSPGTRTYYFELKL